MMTGEIHGWRKIVQATPGRVTRLHTARNELVPLPAIARDLPVLVARRLLRRTPTEPWLTREAVRFLRTAIQADWDIFEIGSGTSTAWYARRARSVIAIESDPIWQRHVASSLAEHPNATVEAVAAYDFPARIAREPDEAFDLVVVDGSEAGLSPDEGRVGCVRAAAPKVRAGGILLLDNSDWPRYAPVDAILESWRCVRFRGFTTGPLTPIETTLHWRPTS